MSLPTRLGAGLLGLVLAFSLVPAAHAYDDFTSDPTAKGNASRFTLAVIPDTQFYARYADPLVGDKYTPRWGSEPWAAQTEWLVKHRQDYNIAFTTHLGDLVDQSDKPGRWQVASKDMAVLEDANMPYSVLAGNHDLGSDNNYLETFPKARAQRPPPRRRAAREEQRERQAGRAGADGLPDGVRRRQRPDGPRRVRPDQQPHHRHGLLAVGPEEADGDAAAAVRPRPARREG
ncbi:metallophosphoesterase [Mariniluteicoccus flavus]